MKLRGLSMPALRELRSVIFTVIAEGDIEGRPWVLYDHDRPNREMGNRSDFCDAIQRRIFATEPIPERKGGTDAGNTQQDSDSAGGSDY